ncbi:MAG TPA: hypothetical protein VLV83_24615 [Acidobacteriota bacterium]|nr:hypothetical protein [Acidobacteriota bacterium]
MILLTKRLAWTGCFVSCLWAAPLWAQDDPLVFPLVADGQGVQAEIALTNAAGEAQEGTIFFWDDRGDPLTLNISGQEVTQWEFYIAAAGAFKISTDGTGPLQSGYVTVHTSDVRNPLNGTIIYSIGNSQLSVPASPLSSEYHVFAEKTPDANSGLAFANPFDQPALLQLSLHDSEGISRAAIDLPLPARAKTARFIDELFHTFFDTLEDGFEGTVQAVSDRPFAMLGIRQRQDGSLATLSGAPTAFNSGTAQLLMSLNAGVDPSAAGFSDDELLSASVSELLDVDQAMLTQYVHLENTSRREPVTLALRYFNSRCQEVLSLLRVLDCGETWSFDPFSADLPEVGALRQHFFGTSGASSAVSAWDFGDGGFILSVTVSGAAPPDAEQAQTLIPRDLAASLSCQAPALPAPEDPLEEGSTPQLSICNARPRPFNVVSGFLSGDAQGECRGPWLRANAQERFASDFTRLLTAAGEGPGACLQAAQPPACLLFTSLSRAEAASCGESSTAGASWQIALPGRPHQLLPLQP